MSRALLILCAMAITAASTAWAVCNALVIHSNGVEVRNYSAVMSPDYAGSDNEGRPGRSNLCVGLEDMPAFAFAFGSGGPSCHDYNNNGLTDLAGFGVFASAYNRCSPP